MQLTNPKWNGQFSRFDLVASTRDGVPSVVRAGEVEIGGGDFVVMAGPCAVESERQLLRTAEAVAEAGARVLRGGAYKPRSSPYAFQGLGLDGLKILRKAREGTPIEQALGSVAEAIHRAGPNREKIRNLLASGTAVGGVSFESTGEPR